jgi:uncharacterized protein (DUF952 family)
MNARPDINSMFKRAGLALETVYYYYHMIYHIVIESEWNAQIVSSEFAPSAFEKEEFIHTSRRHQVAGVVNRYYKGRNDLLLLEIDETRLESKLIDEPASSGELFPHVYGKINKDAILKVSRFDPLQWTN